jgi:hypothetical protein
MELHRLGLIVPVLTLLIVGCTAASGPQAVPVPTPDEAVKATAAALTEENARLSTRVAAVSAPATPMPIAAPPSAPATAVPGPMTPTPVEVPAAPTTPAMTAALPKPSPGATYKGAHSAGGEVLLIVSADGTRVTGYEMSWPQGACIFNSLKVGDVPGQPPPMMIPGKPAGKRSEGFPISDNAFEHESPLSSFKGTFTSDRQAEGTARLTATREEDRQLACYADTVTWSASVGGPG